MITTITVGIGRWADRASLSYIPPNSLKVDSCGRILGQSTDFNGFERLPYKVEVTADGVTYLEFDDGTAVDVAIFKIVDEQ